MIPPPPRSTLFPYTTLFRSLVHGEFVSPILKPKQSWSFTFRAAGTYTYEDERSEEHTSELQSRPHLVCRLLLEKKKKKRQNNNACPPLYYRTLHQHGTRRTR